MPDDHFDPILIAPPPDRRRWPTGILTLIGLLAGAFAGLLIEQVPVGTAAGVAVGVGIDSLLNVWLNDDPGV